MTTEANSENDVETETLTVKHQISDIDLRKRNLKSNVAKYNTHVARFRMLTQKLNKKYILFTEEPPNQLNKKNQLPRTFM